jgi:hypothetical protein
VVSFRQVSPLKPRMHLSSRPYVPHVLPISVFLTWSPEWYLVRSTEHTAPCYALLDHTFWSNKTDFTTPVYGPLTAMCSLCVQQRFASAMDIRYARRPIYKSPFLLAPVTRIKIRQLAICNNLMTLAVKHASVLSLTKSSGLLLHHVQEGRFEVTHLANQETHRKPKLY